MPVCLGVSPPPPPFLFESLCSSQSCASIWFAALWSCCRHTFRKQTVPEVIIHPVETLFLLLCSGRVCGVCVCQTLVSSQFSFPMPFHFYSARNGICWLRREQALLAYNVIPIERLFSGAGLVIAGGDPNFSVAFYLVEAYFITRQAFSWRFHLLI